MVSLNIVSLPLHLDEFRIWLAEQNIDIIAFNETRLDSNINDNQVRLNNYELVRKDRNRNGGGVCVYIKNHINYKVRLDLMSEETESIVIEIVKPNSKPFAIIVAYRPPQSNPDDFFNNILNSIKMLDNERKEIYMWETSTAIFSPTDYTSYYYGKFNCRNI